MERSDHIESEELKCLLQASLQLRWAVSLLPSFDDAALRLYARCLSAVAALIVNARGSQLQLFEGEGTDDKPS